MSTQDKKKPLRPKGKYICKNCLLSGSPSNNIILKELEGGRKRLQCAQCGSTKIQKGCPECGSSDIRYEEDMEEVVCHGCGLVLMSAPPLYCDRTKLDVPWGILLRHIFV